VSIEKRAKWEAAYERTKADDKMYGQTRRLKRKLIADRGHKCQECGRIPDRLDAHHVVKIRHGGANDGSNIILLCEACHYTEHFKRKQS